MIDNEISQISLEDIKSYNSEEIDQLYQKFFNFYTQNTGNLESKLDKFFSAICKDFKSKNRLDGDASLESIIAKVEENPLFAEFIINNFDTLYEFKGTGKAYAVEKKLHEIFGAPEIETTQADIASRFINRICFKSPRTTETNYQQDKIELLSAIDPANQESQKLKFQKFIKLLEKCIDQELDNNEVTSDNFAIRGILQKPDSLQGLDCFEIKKIANIYKRINTPSNDSLMRSKFNDLKTLLKLATHRAVKNSTNFELINSPQALTENDFDPAKLDDLKKQLKIDENLDAKGLMQLFFTLKFLGEENNFISAIKPEKIKQNPLKNYNLKLDNHDLKNITILRSSQKNKTEDDEAIKKLREDFLKKIEAGDKHFCTSFFRNEYDFVSNGESDHGILADLDLPSAGHYRGDFWSEHFAFPKFRRFQGKDVPRLMKFAQDRNILTYTCLRCQDNMILIPVEGNLNPHQTFKEISEEYLFDQHEFRNPNDFKDFFIWSQIDRISDHQIFNIDGKPIRAGSSSLNRFIKYKHPPYTESNVYLNFSDIDGLVVVGNDMNSFINLFTETSLKKIETLADPNKLDHEFANIQWQREVFCEDIKKILEEKLKKLEDDFIKLKEGAESRCNTSRAEILCKYSGAYLECSPTVLFFGQSREFYDENDQILSNSERLKMINPENISIHLQSLIQKTHADLEYIKQLSLMPDRTEIERKLQRNFKFYKKNTQEISLTEAIIDPQNKVDLIKLFLTKEEGSKDFEKFKIFVQQLGFEGFFEASIDPHRAKQSKKSFLNKQIDFIANALEVNLKEQIEIGKKRELIEFQAIPISAISQNPSLEPLPPQLVMQSTIEYPQQNAEFAGLKYQLNQGEIKDLLLAYRLQYSPSVRIAPRETIRYRTPAYQLHFNEKFGLDINKFNLEEALNNAFKNLGGEITNYNRACTKEKKSTEKGRDIHDGHHALTTSYYAKELLKNYQEKRHLFSEEIQAQIADFDNPQKIKDLEILSIMHDSARTDGELDQDEYKNAFYVALRLRQLGDPRFQGDTISEEGLKMITDLDNKESKDEGKSLMSKLIQSADSLAILRCDEFIKGYNKYDFTINECYQDFAKIEDESLREKELTRLKVIGFLLQENEKKFKFPKFLEFSINPFTEFSKDVKTQEASKIFKFEITHDQEGFNKLLKAGCVEYIQSNFTQEQIKIFYPQSKSFLERSATFLGYSPQNFNAHIATLTTSSLSGALVNLQPRPPSPDLRQASVQETQLTSSITMV